MICWVKSSVRFVSANKLLPIALLLLTLPACSSLDYYSQAINGHFELLSREKPIDDILADTNTPGELRQKLTLALKVRAFASRELSLPDNDSYTTYADLQRPFAIWNVVATPAYSIEPQRWCYLFVGCLSYRGYFDKQEALDLAQQLKQEGKDVIVSGAAAYSTLGWMDDPLLNTIVERSETSMIGIIFHELAHQVVYVDGDTEFNEAFATAVEVEGLRRWYTSQDNLDVYTQFLQRKQYRHKIFSKMHAAREALKALYARQVTNDEKQTGKQDVFRDLAQWYRQWRKQHDYAGFDEWMNQDLNNAHLALIATYQEKVPNFLAALQSVNNDMPQFFALVEKMAQMDKTARHDTLSQYRQTDYATH